MEDAVKRTYVLARDDGNILIMSVVIVALLVATGMGYMRWASDEKWDSEYERATIQAYFVAQTGLIERGLTFLRTREPADLPAARVNLLPGTVEGVGIHFNNAVERAPGAEGNLFQRTDSYDVYSTGRVTFYGRKFSGRQAEAIPVDRVATMRARLRSFANYMYLTNREVTEHNEIIWFWTPDTLYGRTHSNDFIGLKYSPTFFGPVSTSQSEFRYYSPQNIYFAYPPVFNAPQVNFPHTAQSIRSAASPFLTDQNGRFGYHFVLKPDGIDIFRYLMGSGGSEVRADSFFMNLNVPNWQAIFVDGEVSIECDPRGFSGQLTIGCSQNMWLIDDVYYSTANPRTGDFDEASTPHLLGLVSEKDIIIEDNIHNGGRGGWEGGTNPAANQNDWNRHSIVITAGLVALGSSFTFQHQNDDWDPYQGPEPDERGWIYLKGAVTQERRGYVHRSCNNGTGYGKAYRYDFRFDRRPPPYYMEALDANGHGLFDIISWGEQRPVRH